jgi:hypothetical protein
MRLAALRRRTPDAPRGGGRAFHLASCIALTFIYGDATLRVVDGLFGGGFGPLLGRRAAPPPAPYSASPPPYSSPPPPPPPPPPLPERHLAAQTDGLRAAEPDECARHAGVLANLYSDLAPWIDRETRVSASQMRDTINFVAAHRGKWDSWVTDTMTPVLIVGNEIFLPLGPPVKDPTNYFWTVLQDLQALVQRHKVADVEFLLNMADTPVVFAQDDGKPSVPIPIFSYCKTRRFLDILIPGYYSPDRTCKQFTETYNAKYPWRAKREALFARYTHFCKPRDQRDEYARRLPPCARSYFAALAMKSTSSEVPIDVAPLNVVNDTKDPSLEYGRRLLRNGSSLALGEHGRYKYLLDTDGFTSAYKLQQLLSTNSLVLHHKSPWRSFYHAALRPWAHYVPLWQSSADDAVRLLGWLRRHDALAQQIATNAQAFACDQLTQRGRLCYWRRALAEYSSLLGYAPSRARRPRAFPLARLNIMCRVRDGPVRRAPQRPPRFASPGVPRALCPSLRASPPAAAERLLFQREARTRAQGLQLHQARPRLGRRV